MMLAWIMEYQKETYLAFGDALLTTTFRKAFKRVFLRNVWLFNVASRGLEMAVGLGMVAVAAITFA